MRYTIVKQSQFSGNKTTVYSVIKCGDQETFFEKFVRENITSHLSETNDIVKRLRSIGHVTGAREGYFKFDEGIPGDGVCALFDEEESNLRLYCIRYGAQLIILGDGGPKPKSIRAFQSDDNLKKTNYFMRWLSCEITARIKNREIKYINDALDFTGDFEFENEENE